MPPAGSGGEAAELASNLRRAMWQNSSSMTNKQPLVPAPPGKAHDHGGAVKEALRKVWRLAAPHAAAYQKALLDRRFPPTSTC